MKCWVEGILLMLAVVLTPLLLFGVVGLVVYICSVIGGVVDKAARRSRALTIGGKAVGVVGLAIVLLILAIGVTGAAVAAHRAVCQRGFWKAYSSVWTTP